MNNARAAYGGVQPINAIAPQAPAATHQGQVQAGQARLNDSLVAQSQQTMRVPATPVKGLLARASGSKANKPGAMPRMPDITQGGRYV